MANPNCGPCGPSDNQSIGSVTITQGYEKNFFINLFYTDILSPYDLTGCLEVIVALPGANGTPVEMKKTLNTVAIIGSPGAGYLQIRVSPTNSALIQVNPYEQQFQDIQVIVTNADSSETVFVVQGILNVIAPPLGVIT